MTRRCFESTKCPLKVNLRGVAGGVIVILCYALSAPAQVTNSQQSTQVSPPKTALSVDQNASAIEGPSPAHKYFTDVEVVNQNGQHLRFYTDLLRGKVVIINSFFATCQGSCLPMNRNLERLQDALGDHVGKDVHIISISVDPTVDTPANLREYARKLHARPGWYFLTGEKQNVGTALTKLGQFVDDKQNHLNIIIIGNDRTGLWKKAFALAPPEELFKVVESVLNDQVPGNK